MNFEFSDSIAGYVKAYDKEARVITLLTGDGGPRMDFDTENLTVKLPEVKHRPKIKVTVVPVDRS